MGPNPTGRAKTDAKWSVLTQVSGFPIGRPAPTPDVPQGMCMDKGYDYDGVRATLAEFGFTAHVKGLGEEAEAKRAAGSEAWRPVVERTHS